MRKLFRGLFWVALALGVIVGGLRGLVLRWWQVPMGDPSLEASIAPSLRGGDWVILWRASSPAFGDLVVCPEPGSPGRVAIGRIVGEQADTVEIEGNQAWINNGRVATEFACAERKFIVHDPVSGTEVEGFCQMEVVGGVEHMRGSATTQSNTPIRTKHTVGPGMVFLLSDDRIYPWDSRRYGEVEQKTCTEAVVFRLWSKDGFLDVKNRFESIR